MPAVLSWSARGARSAPECPCSPYFHSYVCLLIWSVCWSVGLPGLSRLSGYSSLPCWSDLSGGSVYLVGRIYWVVGLSIGRSVWFVWLVCLLVYWSTCWSVRLLIVDLACLICLVCLVGLVYLIGLICLMVCLLVYLASLVCLLTSMLVGCLLVCLLV